MRATALAILALVVGIASTPRTAHAEDAPPYAWGPLRFDMGLGLLSDRHREAILLLRAALGVSLGTATPSGDGRVHGWRWSFGVEAGEEVPQQLAAWSTWAAFAEAGYAFGNYSPAGPTPDTTVFARVAPYCSSLIGGCGVRMALGVSLPRWTESVWERAGTPPEKEQGVSPEGPGDGILLIGAALVAPFASIGHFEIVGELDLDGDARLGGFLGWGF